MTETEQVAQDEALTSLRTRLVGAWELVRWTSDGAPCTMFGASPRGHLFYSRDGQMSAALLSGDRLPLPIQGDEIASARILAAPRSWAHWLSIFMRHLSYCGRYELASAHTVLHYIEACSIPNWVGGTQRRGLRFSGHELILSNRIGWALHHLHWRPI